MATIRRSTPTAVVTGCLALALATAASAQSIVLDGKPLSLPQPPVNREGTILLPMRAVFQALGAEVVWYPGEHKVEARRGDDLVELWMGTPVAQVNHEPVQLNVPPLLLGGVAYVPLRVVAVGLGCDVRWDAATKTVAISGGDPATGETGQAGAIPWLTSLDEGLKQAQARQRPVLLDFFAPWCSPCRMMDKDTWEHEGVIAGTGKFIPVRLNVDEHSDEAVRFDVVSIPCVIFLDSSGKVLGRSEGWVGPEDMLKLMQEHGGG